MSTEVEPEVEVEKTLRDFRQGIEAALFYAGGSFNFDDVAAGVESGAMQFWPGRNSVIITQLQQYPRRKALWFFLAAGSDKELRAMVPGILEWGKLQGCTDAEFLGRRGWLRSFLIEDGWMDTRMVFLTRGL